MISTTEFEAARPRLMAIAHRMLGSVHDAEDAVQSAWLRAHGAAPAEIDSPAAWLTTVLTRVCLDQLRQRALRERTHRPITELPDDAVAADEDYLRREDVSRALLVLLGRLTPPQRVAYVLHDLFSVPFGPIGDVLGTSSAAAKKHASRARARIRGATPAEAPEQAPHREVVAAFLDAARGGDLETLVALMAPDCVRVADASLLPPGSATAVSGRTEVARETRLFVDRIRASTPMRVNGMHAHVIAPGGHPLAAIAIDTTGTAVSRITIRRIQPADILTAA